MPDGVTVVSARAALRAATGEVHERLHAVPAFRDLAEGRVTRAEYAALLRRLLGFHAPLEARLAAVPALDAFVDVDARRRAWLIREDLAALDEPDAVGVLDLAPMEDAGFAMGCLYVTEGATLGGLHLARALDGVLPAGVEGRRFLLGHGARHGEMWREFCAALEQCGAEPEQRARMVEGAVEAFGWFEGWVSNPGRVVLTKLA